jgi:hypothetical protein
MMNSRKIAGVKKNNSVQSAGVSLDHAYLKLLEATLQEWIGVDDCAAYDDLLRCAQRKILK